MKRDAKRGIPNPIILPKSNRIPISHHMEYEARRDEEMIALMNKFPRTCLSERGVNISIPSLPMYTELAPNNSMPKGTRF